MSDKTDSKKSAVKRKRPGRPRKKVPKDEIPRQGIVNEPMNKDEVDERARHTVEMVYANPELWKKIFTMFNHLSVQLVRMHFHAAGISIITQDHLQKSDVLVEIIGERLHRYYCAEPLEIGVDQYHFLQFLQTLKKDHSKITFISTKETQRSKLLVILHNATVDEDSEWGLEVSDVKPYDGTIHKDLEFENEYPLSFTLSAKYFKDKVAAWMRLGNVIKIEKEYDGELRISHAFEDKKGIHYTRFKNAKKINLVANIEEDDMFAMSVLLQNLKPIAKSIVADKITITAHEELPLIFTSLLDEDIDEDTRKPIPNTEVCRIKILTEIVNLED